MHLEHGVRVEQARSHTAEAVALAAPSVAAVPSVQQPVMQALRTEPTSSVHGQLAKSRMHPQLTPKWAEISVTELQHWWEHSAVFALSTPCVARYFPLPYKCLCLPGGPMHEREPSHRCYITPPY